VSSASLLQRIRYSRRCYAVCAIARSGSNLLTDGLRETGRAGRPKQFFCKLFEPKYAAKYQANPETDFAAYISRVIDVTSSSNGVFGFKLMGWYLDEFLERLRKTGAFGNGTDARLLEAAFPRLRLIYVYRANKLRQAISKARAYQSGLWKVQVGQSQFSEARFDPELIERCQDEVRREDAVWGNFFARSTIQPLRIDYEELCRDYKGTLQAVLAFLKVRLPARAKIGGPSTIRQGDELSLEWEERYRSQRETLPVIHS